ncbi:hypothetical protein MTO96_007857 [Rhipicephalus appendiculatus]
MELDKGYLLPGEACNSDKVIIVSDHNQRQNVYVTVAHEIGHTLGSDHDGEGTSVNCRAPLKLAACSQTNTYHPRLRIRKLVVKRVQKCEPYLPQGHALVATETYDECTFSCYTDAMYSFVLPDEDGTPCDPNNLFKKCVKGICKVKY